MLNNIIAHYKLTKLQFKNFIIVHFTFKEGTRKIKINIIFNERFTGELQNTNHMQQITNKIKLPEFYSCSLL